MTPEREKDFKEQARDIIDNVASVAKDAFTKFIDRLEQLAEEINPNKPSNSEENSKSEDKPSE